MVTTCKLKLDLIKEALVDGRLRVAPELLQMRQQLIEARNRNVIHGGIWYDSLSRHG